MSALGQMTIMVASLFQTDGQSSQRYHLYGNGDPTLPHLRNRCFQAVCLKVARLFQTWRPDEPEYPPG
jgi:hypothetical protein